MKAERRHELQTNTLARSIENLPNTWREHGSKIALVVIAVLLVVVLVRMWLTNRTEKANRMAESLSLARSAIAGLRDTVFWSSERTSAAEAKERIDNVRRTVDNTLNDVLNEAGDESQQAEAKVLRGDLYYEIAMIGEFPEAATQPSLRPEKKPDELMKTAGDAYKEVLDQAGSLPPALVARARFGLAAIAENQHNWDAALSHYEAIRTGGTLGPAIKDQAQFRISLLKEAQKDRVIGRPRRASDTQPTTGPTTVPATTNPFQISL